MIKRFVLDSRETWKEFRKGLITASQVNRIMAEPKKGNEVSVGAETYVLELIEALNAEPELEFYSRSMEWGNEQEPQAVMRYCQENNLDVNSPDVIYTSIGGFVFFTWKDIAGGTPDIILPKQKRNVEIKCPDTTTHLYYLLKLNQSNFQKELGKYYDQMQFNMFLTGAESTDFQSFDPRVKKYENQSFIINIERDEKRIKEITDKIEIVNEYKIKLLNQLK